MTGSNTSKEAELIAQQVSSLAERISVLEKRLDEVEKVNARLEQAALTTARALQEIAGHWEWLVRLSCPTSYRNPRPD